MKTEIVFVCKECGKQLMKWMGRCPACGEWNTVVEKEVSTVKGRKLTTDDSNGEAGTIISLADIKGDVRPRLKTRMGELDRVLGGGLVRGSVILVGGDPGIGKSTLLMQALGALALTGEKVLYVSGEESSEQLKLRAERLGVNGKSFLILIENRLEPIVEKITDASVSVVVLDSVQSVYGHSVPVIPGVSVKSVKSRTAYPAASKQVGPHVSSWATLPRTASSQAPRYWNTWWTQYFTLKESADILTVFFER